MAKLLLGVLAVPANGESSLDIPRGCLSFFVQARTAVDVKMATTAGGTRSEEPRYWTIKAGSDFGASVDGQRFFEEGQTLFFGAASAVTVELAMVVADPGCGDGGHQS